MHFCLTCSDVIALDLVHLDLLLLFDFACIVLLCSVSGFDAELLIVTASSRNHAVNLLQDEECPPEVEDAVNQDCEEELEEQQLVAKLDSWLLEPHPV